MPDRSRRRLALVALALLVPAPTLAVCATMIFARGKLGMAVWGLSKLWILALPLVWLRRVECAPLRPPPWRREGLVFGLLTGLAAAAVFVALFELALRRSIDPAELRDMLRANHLDDARAYLAMAAYTVVPNSLLEEYVWRWFVFRRFEELVPARAAVVASALAFTLHHVVVLATQFTPTFATLGSLAVFGAAILWSSTYLRYRSVWPCWLSHALVDVAVFWAGWQLARLP